MKLRCMLCIIVDHSQRRTYVDTLAINVNAASRHMQRKIIPLQVSRRQKDCFESNEYQLCKRPILSEILSWLLRHCSSLSRSACSNGGCPLRLVWAAAPPVPKIAFLLFKSVLVNLCSFLRSPMAVVVCWSRSAAVVVWYSHQICKKCYRSSPSTFVCSGMHNL